MITRVFVTYISYKENIMNLRRVICLFLSFMIAASYSTVFADGADKNGDGYTTYLEGLTFPDRNTSVSKKHNRRRYHLYGERSKEKFHPQALYQGREIMVLRKSFLKALECFSAGRRIFIFFQRVQMLTWAR